MHVEELTRTKEDSHNYGLSLVIPAYNEEMRIKKVLQNFIFKVPEYEIIVVCNGCHDETPNIVNDLSKTYPNIIKMVNIPQKLGKGGAIVEGFKIAEREIIGFDDADESVAPEDITKMVNALADNDGLIGSRKINGSEILVHQPMKRRIASRIFNIIVRLLFGLNYNDTQCGAKIFRKHAVKDVLPSITVRDFVFDVELLWKLKRKGYMIREFPITWSHSEGSTFSMKSTPGMFVSLLKLRFSSK